MLNKDTVYSDNSIVTTKEISLLFDKQFAGNMDSPTIIGIVGDEVDGFTICSRVAIDYYTA